METPMTESSPVHSAVPPEVSQTVSRRRAWVGIVMTVVALVAFAALALSAMLWQRLDAAQQELVRRSQDTLGKAIEARTLAEQSGALVDSIQARLSVAEVKLSEVSLQRSQLEELMLSVSRSRDDNLVQDLESAIRLAQQQTELTGTVQPLLAALQAADQRIARAAQPRLNPVQRAIARDVERIQNAALADLPTMLNRVDELVRQVDEWPVRNQVGAVQLSPVRSEVAAEPQEARTQTDAGNDAGASAAAGLAAPASAHIPAAGAEVADGWARLTSGWGDFWRGLWADLTREGRELVRVSRIDEPDAMLLAPEQAYLLRENVKLKLLNARLALLSRQANVVQRDLRSIDNSIGRYFDSEDPGVQSAHASIKDLRDQLVSLDLPRPDESLAALLVAAGGR
jgi:uroporphyrin-III C-methyltransferase